MNPLPAQPIAFRSVPPPPTAREDDPLCVLDLHRLLVPRPAATFFMRAGSDALAASSVRRGDLLVVDRSCAAADGDLVVAPLAGRLVVRRLRLDADGALLCADRGAPARLDADQPQVLWGVVTAVVRQLRGRRAEPEDAP